MWLRFRMGAAERELFLRNAGYSSQLANDRRYLDNDQLSGISGTDWWRPDQITNFESGNLLKETGRPRYGSNLLMSRGSDPITVYLFVTTL